MPDEFLGSPNREEEEREDSGGGFPDGFTVVGVGASAGGLEAFSELLRHLPVDTGMCFVLVQHLDPRHVSFLAELLAQQTSIPVVQVHEDVAAEPNRIYVIAPNTALRIDRRELKLEPRSPSGEPHRPIDVFFASLAEDLRANAIGVVLSGTASDGTLGLKAIKREGGITFVQDASAKFDSMPRNAIAAGVADFVLSPGRIAEELTAIARYPYRDRRKRGDLAEQYDVALHRVMTLLRHETGVDFTQYKQPTLIRRLTRRLVLRQASDLDAYVVLLEREGEELRALFNDLLINVTEFFRDGPVFEGLKRFAFPKIMRERTRPGPIRVWVPGCSTGEEVYSIAMALTEFLEGDNETAVQMFGTDVSSAAIDKARTGMYEESAVATMVPERLRRFFTRMDSGYQISRQIRECCIFSRHNIGKDPPLSRMDLISCRNLLIYFSPALQKRVISTFGYALQPNGCLLLGTSESLGTLAECFESISEENKIYCRKANLPQSAFDFSERVSSFSIPEHRFRTPALRERNDGPETVQTFVDRMLLSQYGPSCVVVNQGLQIVEYRGDLTAFLRVKAAIPNADVVDAVCEELAGPLRAALEQARKTRVIARLEKIAVGRASELYFVGMVVVPISATLTGPHFVVVFDQTAPRAGSGPRDERDQASHAEHLESELAATRQYLQSIIEELRSTIEEAQSANEELQSTNEELQTAKEELQSSNEELNTINTEMQSRNAELSQLNDDLMNLLSSMNMPIVMMSRDLRIRRFTPMAERVLHLIATDVGRPISDLKPRINVPNLEQILNGVLDSLVAFEQEVQDQEGRWYLMRVRPYRTHDNRIEGAVLQLLDMGELKRSLEEVRFARDYAQAIVDTVREPLVVLDQEMVIQNANRAFFEFVDLTPEAAHGRSVLDVGIKLFESTRARTLIGELFRSGTQARGIELETESEGSRRVIQLNSRRLRTPDQADRLLLAFQDITEQKQAAEARYRRLFESARDGIILVDPVTGEITDLNPFVSQLLGYERRELTGKKFWEVEPSRSIPGAKAFIEQIRDQGVVRSPDLDFTTSDGRILQTEVIGNIYQDLDGRTIQLNIRDLTERRKFDQELQHTARLESLGLLAGGIAHDFNNLLTGIVGNASLVYTEMSSGDANRRHLRDVIDAGERAAFLTRQMLAYAGKGRFLTQEIDLGDLVREISALIRTSIPKQVELVLNLAPDLATIDADASQIQQLVMNLVINGAEAVPDNNTGRVEVRTGSRELTAQDISNSYSADQLTPGPFVTMEVNDTGVGMDETTKARIFDPFFTTKFTGRGLGLAAVQGIVRSHHGAIRVYSTPGFGTSFQVLLPAKRDGRRAAAPKMPLLRRPGAGVVLVVDDEELVRSLAQAILTRAGWKVMTAKDGKSGMEMFREHHQILEAVLLDLLMPVAGGEETLDAMQSLDPNVPIVVTSGFDESEVLRRFEGKRLAGFVQKPFNVDQLLDVMTRVQEGKGADSV